MQVTKARVGVDKIKISLAFPHMKKAHECAELEHDTFAGIAQWADSVRRHEFAEIGGGTGTFRRLRPPAAMTKANQPLVSGGAIHVRYGRHRGAYRAWVEFNPDKSCLGELAFHFNLMLPLGFETLARHGRVYYCEVFLDLDGVRFDQCCFLDPTLRTGYTGFVPKGTLYVGSRHGNRSYTIYDKTQELATHGVELGHERLRVEAKLQSGFPVEDMRLIKNPFLSMLALERTTLCASDRAGASRLACYLEHGIPIQETFFKMLDTQQRKAVAVELAELVPSWWSPTSDFQSFRPQEWIDVLRQCGRDGTNWLPPAAFPKRSAPVQSIARHHPSAGVVPLRTAPQ